VSKVHSLEELIYHYNASGRKTMLLQEFIQWDTYIRVPTIGRRWARAIRYDPAPMGWAATTRTTTCCRGRCATRPRSWRCVSTRRSATT